MYTIMEIINYLFGGISMKQKIAVLGPGSWGTALAQTLAETGMMSGFGEMYLNRLTKSIRIIQINIFTRFDDPRIDYRI